MEAAGGSPLATRHPMAWVPGQECNPSTLGMGAAALLFPSAATQNGGADAAKNCAAEATAGE